MIQISNTWEVSLNNCPHCDIDLDIKSSSAKGLRFCMQNLFLMAEIHTKRCRGNKEKRLTKVYIKETIFDKYSKKTFYNNEKILL
jgi:hypothetical protein